MGYHSYRTSVSAKNTTEKVITLRHRAAAGVQLVYVKCPETYQDAIQTAVDEYIELAAYASQREHIALFMTAKLRDHQERVRIAASAWEGIRQRLLEHEIIDVEVLEQPPRSPAAVIIDMSPMEPPPPIYYADEKNRSDFLTVDSESSRPPTPSSRSRSRSPSSANVASRAFQWLKAEITGSSSH